MRFQRLAVAGSVALSLLVAGCTDDKTDTTGVIAAEAGVGTGTESGVHDLSFYEPPSPLPEGKPGDLIRVERTLAPPGAKAWKILYLSTFSDGQPVAVSGLVVAPDSAPPDGGRPVVAWAHGTDGGARGCAPSLAPGAVRNLLTYFSFQSPYRIDIGVPALSEFLEAGYAVVATDYQGLGTPGVHQYTVAATELHNVYDSVKAAQEIEDADAGDDVVVLGWSQGGGAALFAGQDTAYAQPLRVKGVVGLAPAADLGPIYLGQVAPGPVNSASPSHSASLQLNLFRGMAAAYPELNVNEVLTPAGVQALQGYNLQCSHHLADVIEETVPDVSALFQTARPANWVARINQNTAGNAPSQAPILVAQGTADTVINPNSTTQYVQRACALNQPVTYTMYEGVTHDTVPFAAQDEYVAWIAARFADQPAPSNCASAGTPVPIAPPPGSVPGPPPTAPAPTAAPTPAPVP